MQRPKNRTGEQPDRDDERFVKWIPLVVPLLAVLLAILAYLILGAVA